MGHFGQKALDWSEVEPVWIRIFLFTKKLCVYLTCTIRVDGKNQAKSSLHQLMYMRALELNRCPQCCWTWHCIVNLWQAIFSDLSHGCHLCFNQYWKKNSPPLLKSVLIQQCENTPLQANACIQNLTKLKYVNINSKIYLKYEK